MADPTPFWQTVAGVVLGGVLTAVGGVVTQIMTKRLERNAEREKTRMAKFEELIGALYDHHRWMGEIKERHVLDDDTVLPRVDPMAKVWAIMSAYFPQFEQRVDGYAVASHAYGRWLTTESEKRGKPGYEEEKEAVERAYNDAFSSLVNPLIQAARTNFAS